MRTAIDVSLTGALCTGISPPSISARALMPTNPNDLAQSLRVCPGHGALRAPSAWRGGDRASPNARSDKLFDLNRGALRFSSDN
jgi:hypothetical protein